MELQLLRPFFVSKGLACLEIARTIDKDFRQWLKALATLGAILAMVPTVESAPLPEYDRVRILTAERQIADAELTDQNGQPFRLSSLQGDVALLLFGFTHCADVCPLGLSQMRMLADSGKVDNENISYVLISVDGERDTPAVMKAYLQNFSPAFIGLTGERRAVKRIAKNFSAAFFKENATGQENDYQVSHSPQIFVVDPAGRLRAEFYNASVEAMAGVAQALIAEGPINPES